MTAPGAGGRRAANLGRHTGTSLALVAASVAAHMWAGGTPPDSCRAVIALLGLSSFVTGIATYLAHRTRGGLSVLAVFGVGQLVMSGVLAAPGRDHGALWSWNSALLHAATSVLLAAMVLGLGRLVGWLGELVDRVLPRCWSAHPTPPAWSAIVAVTGLEAHRDRRTASRFGSRAPPVFP